MKHTPIELADGVAFTALWLGVTAFVVFIVVAMVHVFESTPALSTFRF